MICTRCNSFHPGIPGRLCPVCSEPLVLETDETRDALVLGRIRAYLQKWKSQKKISTNAAKEIESALAEEVPFKKKNSRVYTESFFTLPIELFFKWISNIIKEFINLFETPNFSHADEFNHLEDATETVFKDNQNLKGLGGVAELDRESFDPSQLPTFLKPLFNEYIWWFIGTILILSGSVMGIREAWQSLEGFYKPLTLLFAFSVYQCLFVGMGLFVNKKSPPVAKVLGIISILLFPIVFAVCSDLLLMHLLAGIVGIVILVSFSFFLLQLHARIFELDRFTLFFAVIPIALVQSLVPYLRGEWISILFLFFPLIIISYNAFDMQKMEARTGKGMFLLSVYMGFSVLTIFFSPDWGKQRAFSLGSLNSGILILWFTLFSYIIGQTTAGLRKAREHLNLYGVFEIITLAVVLVFSILSGSYLYFFPSTNLVLSIERLLYLLSPIVGTVIFAFSIRNHIPAFHIFISLLVFTGYIIGIEIIAIPNWSIAIAFLVPTFLLVFAPDVKNVQKKKFLFWGILVGVITNIYYLQFIFVPQFLRSEFFQIPNQEVQLLYVLPACFTGILFFGAMLFLSKRMHSFLAIFGSFGLITFLAGLSLFFQLGPVMSRLSILFLASGILYALLGIIDKKKIIDKRSSLLFDDLSLLFSFLGLFTIIGSPGERFLEESGFIALTGLIFVFRSSRDFTPIGTFLGLAVLSIGVFRAIHFLYIVPSTASNAFLAALVSLVLLMIHFFTFETGNYGEKTRRFFEIMQIPNSVNFRRGLHISTGYLTVGFVVYSIFLFFLWLGLPDQPERERMILSCLLLSLVSALAFFLKGDMGFFLRGSTFLLGMFFFTIAMAAISNRIGRPLNPHIVGINLTIGVLGLWLLAIVLKLYGEKIASLLENPKQGIYYFFVPLFSMLAIGLVLALDIFLIVPFPFSRFLYIVPPTFLLGFGLAIFLFSMERDWRLGQRLSVFLFLLFCGLTAVQLHPFGIELLPLDLPGSRWVPKETIASAFFNWLNPSFFLPIQLDIPILLKRFVVGISLGGIFFSLLAFLFSIPKIFGILGVKLELEISENYKKLFQSGGIISIAFVLIFAFQYAYIYPAILALCTITCLALSGAKSLAQIAIGLVLLVIYQGGVSLLPTYPFEAGLILALLGLGFANAPRFVIGKEKFAKTLERSHGAALFYSLVGLVYSLAYLSATNPNYSFYSILQGVSFSLSGFWQQNLAIGIVFFIFSMSILSGSFLWIEDISKSGSFGSVLLFAISLGLMFPASCFQTICTGSTTLTQMLPYFIGSTSVTVAIFYILSEFWISSRKDISYGMKTCLNFLIVVVGIMITYLVQLNINLTIPFSGAVSSSGILLIVLVTVHSSYKYKKAIHLYFAQSAISAFYLNLKPAFPQYLTPQIDAIFALLFAFLLTGVTAVASRIGVPALAESTRRFAAILPLLAIFVLPSETSYENAGFASIVSILYAVLASTSSNKLYAILSALSANLAIFTAVMASDIQGLEVYLAPVGMFTLFLGHIFRENLQDLTKRMIQIVGGLLFYLPSSIKISLEIGMGADPMYAIVFGILCLIGISLGMLFHIKSYLFLGTLFFTLNLVANLLQTGLRNQRLGFILLSFCGLFIIFSLIFITLNKEKIQNWTGKIRKYISTFD